MSKDPTFSPMPTYLGPSETKPPKRGDLGKITLSFDRPTRSQCPHSEICEDYTECRTKPVGTDPIEDLIFRKLTSTLSLYDDHPEKLRVLAKDLRALIRKEM